MLPELSTIREIRKKYGMTQSELAKLAGVSQSLIAKIEAGRIDPTYTNVKRIIVSLDDLHKKKQIKAKDIMSPSVISARQSDSLPSVTKKMKKHGISQMPVIEEHKSIGLISESIILDALLEKGAELVGDVMGDAPPVIPTSTTMEAVANLLRYAPMILVTEKGKVEGVITKADLIAKAYGG